MKKLSIQTVTILVNNEKLNIISLESKTDKYYIYSNNENLINNIDENLFSKMQFNEEIQITPKKKLNDLKLSISFDKEKNTYSILFNNSIVYFLKNNKNLIANNESLKLILSNGSLYNLLQVNKINYNNETLPDQKNNLVDNILSKNNSNIKNINFSNRCIDIKENTNTNTIYDNKNNEEDVINKLKNKEFLNENIDILNEVTNNIEKINNNIENKKIVKDEIKNNEEINNNIENKIPVLKEETLNEESNTQALNEESNKQVLEVETLKEESNTQSLNEESNKQALEVETLKEESNKQALNEESNKQALNEESNKQALEVETLKEESNKEIGNDYINNKKNQLDNEIFNLENILTDFNKLFLFNENKAEENITNIKKENKDLKKNIKPIITSLNTEVSKTNIFNEQNIINTIDSTNIKNINNFKIPNIDNNIYNTKINYQNSVYKISTIKLIPSNDLNLYNLYKTSINKKNIINKSNLAFELEKENSSYLINYSNIKYLINKINNSIIVTNLSTKNSQIVKNKDNFKLGLNDFVLYNESMIILPMVAKKIFDNNYGTAYNLYFPKT